MPRRMGVHRPRPASAHVPDPEFELGSDQVYPTPETLAHLREMLHEPSTARSQAVLAHWTDQLGAWLDEREERERLATAAREREEKEKEERETTAREEKGREAINDEVDVVKEEEETDAETQGVSLVRASEPQTATFEEPKPPAQLAPAILRRPYAPAPIEVASLELVQKPAQQPETTARDDEGEPSTEEQQSREAEVELENCLAAMGEPNPPPTSTNPASQPHVAKPVPTAPAATEIPMWLEIRLRHDTGSKRKAYNSRRQLQLDDYEPQHLGGDSRAHPRQPEDP